MSGSVPTRNSYSRSHNTSSSLGTSLNPSHRVTRRKSTTLNAASSAQAMSQAINIDQSAARRSLPSRNALNSLSQASYPSPPSSLPQPDDKNKVKARRGSDGSVLSKKKTPVVELKCETCGKGYKHSSCLTKHLWEHTPEWQYTSKLLISKHQQVQLLEAASVLVAMNQDPVPQSDAKLSDSENSSASPAASASDSRDDDISSAETTPPPQGEHPFGHRKRYSNTSSIVSRSYQSNMSEFALQRPDSAHGRQWSTSSSRPITAATSLAQSYPDEDQADLAAAVGLLSCSYGTPTHGPASFNSHIPPVPPLPAKYQGMSGGSYQPSLLSNAQRFQDDVDMDESYSDDEDHENVRPDEADDGVFGNMEE